jgi:hypothetical protein
MSLHVRHTTAATVTVDTGCATFHRTIRSWDLLPQRTRKDLTLCFVFRQHKAVADVLQSNDDDDTGNYYILLFSEGKAKDDRYDQSYKDVRV